MLSRGLAATTAIALLAFLAPSASASRPFDWATLHKGEDPNRLRLVVRTVTGIEKPKSLQLRFDGEGMKARELKGSVGRWALGEKTAEERAFTVAIAEHIDLFGEARVRAIGRYGFGCGDATFRVLFKLKELNERDDDAQFRKATSCEDRTSESAKGDEDALFGKKYHSLSVTKEDEPKPLVEGTRFWVKFQENDDRTSVSWRAGCNYFGARIKIKSDVIDVKRRSIVSTDMGCPSEAHRRQDRFFARFFAKDPSWSATGEDLTLTTDRVAIRLTREGN